MVSGQRQSLEGGLFVWLSFNAGAPHTIHIIEHSSYLRVHRVGPRTDSHVASNHDNFV